MNFWRPWHTVALVVIIILIVAIGLFVPAESRQPGWFVTVVLLLAFALVAGKGITGRWTGALIDRRNMMSLSRLQLLSWTVLILGAYLTAALGNLSAGLPDALAVAIPSDLWWLMGISTTSLVASPLLKANKLDVIAVNTAMGDARFSDMFRGEENDNRQMLDVAKVQMFYFTLILVIAYGASLSGAMRVFPITELPDMSAGMVTLLGISHAGYLTSKGVKHA